MSTANKTIFTLVAAGVLLLASQLVVDHWSPPIASAETVRTSKSTRVLSSPRTTGRVVARVAAGRDLEVLGRKGRWIKVRASGKTGWITSSSAKSTRNARKSVTKTRRRPVVERRSETKKRKKQASARTKPKAKAKAKPKRNSKRVAARSPEPVRSKTKRPANLDDDEEFLVGEEIEADAERKRIAAREREAELRREREAREREQREADRQKRAAARAERERREREREERELEERRRELAARRERQDGERKRRPVRGGDYEEFDLDDDDDRASDRDREPVAARDRDRERDVDESRSRDDYRDDYDDSDEEEDDRGPAKRRVVVVKVDAAEVRAKPSERAAELGIAEDGEKLYVVRETRSGAWMLVEDKEGKTGWIRSKYVDGGEHRATATESKVVARGGITAGYTSLGSIFTSNGVGELANYEFTTAAASASVGGEIVFEYSPSLLLACDARYSGTRADPGIRFMNSAGDVADIALTNHEVDAGARLGYRMSGSVGTVIYGRVGYHYGMFSIDDVSNFEVNLAMLPSEVLKGMTVGGEIDITRFGRNLGIRVSGDLLYPNGTRQQTDGLEDGAQSKVTAAWVTGQITYRTKASITIDAIYRYSYANTDWTGTADHSMRPHDASLASRKDVGHTAMLGVGRSF